MNFSDKTKEELIQELVKIKSEHFETENKNKFLIENISDIFYEYDKNGVLTYISPIVEKIFGYTQSEIIGKNFIEFVGDKAAFLFQNLLNLTAGEQVSNEYEMFTKNGEARWLRFSTKAIFNQNELFAGGNGMLVDVTEKKLTEQALELSQEKYRNMVKSIDEVIFEVSSDGIIRYISPAIEKVLGYTKEELTGENVFSYIYPDDIPLITKALSELPTNPSPGIEYRYYKKGGEVCWVLSSTKPIVEEEKIVGRIGVLIDINERKLSKEKLRQSEQRYKTFFEGNPSIMMLIDPETGEINDANPAASKYYGWSRENICSMNIADINRLSQEEIISEMQLAKNEKRNYFNFKHLLANGEIRDVEVYSGPMEFDDTTLLYSIIHDVTERVQIENELLNNKEKYRKDLLLLLCCNPNFKNIITFY